MKSSSWHSHHSTKQMLRKERQLDRCTLVRLLRYSPNTGIFTWRVNVGAKIKAGDRAGSRNTRGYWRIGIDGNTFKLHRLAWFYCYGVWPSHKLDHRNGDLGDNSLQNLRVCLGESDNDQNQRKPHRDNKSGFLGVTPVRNGFMATIGVDSLVYYLGRYKTAEEAHAVYILHKRELHNFCTI